MKQEKRAVKGEGTAAEGEGLMERGLSREAWIRWGARQVIQRAVKAEVRTLLVDDEKVRRLNGPAGVVRNG